MRYLVNPLEFARDLGADRVSEGTKAGYVAAGWILQDLNYAWHSAYADGAPSSAGYLSAAAVTAVAVGIGFHANESGDGRRFVERFVCLSMILSVWMLFSGLVIAALVYAAGIRGRLYADIALGSSWLLWLGYVVALRWLILQAATPQPPPLPGPDPRG